MLVLTLQAPDRVVPKQQATVQNDFVQQTNIQYPGIVNCSTHDDFRMQSPFT